MILSEAPQGQNYVPINKCYLLIPCSLSHDCTVEKESEMGQRPSGMGSCCRLNAEAGVRTPLFCEATSKRSAKMSNRAFFSL